MTVPQYPNTGAAPLPQRRLSKSSLTSFILGILGCIPFITGALAVLFGIIGFVKTGKPGVSGRWMAIVGTILGALSIVAWIFSIGSIAALVGIAVAATEPPRTATHDFIKNLAAGDLTAAKIQGPGFSDEQLEKLSEDTKKMGTFVDTTFYRTNVENDSAELMGTAQFSSGTHEVSAGLEKENGAWHVQSIDIKPEK